MVYLQKKGPYAFARYKVCKQNKNDVAPCSEKWLSFIGNSNQISKFAKMFLFINKKYELEQTGKIQKYVSVIARKIYSTQLTWNNLSFYMKQ